MEVSSPTVTHQFDPFEVRFKIKNKLFTYEKIIMAAATGTGDAFIVSGTTNVSYDVSLS